MHDERSHPLLQQTALSVNPFIDLPKPPTLPHNYASLPSTLPPSSINAPPAPSHPDRPAYVTSSSGFAAHPSTIISQNQALLEQLDRQKAEASKKVQEWEKGIQERDLAEKRRKAPGWLDSEQHMLQPEKTGADRAREQEASLMDEPASAGRQEGRGGDDGAGRDRTGEDLGAAMDRAAFVNFATKPHSDSTQFLLFSYNTSRIPTERDMDVARQLSSWYKNETSVTIILVQDGTKYTLPKQMVCTISDYFSKALEGDFKEAHERELKLSECGAETFDVVLYFHVFKYLPNGIHSEDQTQLLLVNLWLFGDIYLLPRLKDLAFKAVSGRLNRQLPQLDVLAKVLAFSPDDSTLRALFVEKATSGIFQGAYTEEVRAGLAEIEGFFKIMADALAVGKSGRVIADALAEGSNSDSRSPTNTSTPVHTAIGSTVPVTTTTVRSSSVPTHPIGLSAPAQARRPVAPSPNSFATQRVKQVERPPHSSEAMSNTQRALVQHALVRKRKLDR
ncbi:hypothetical protein KC360_g3177 [Hortaea werneckii]|nr:hypothetical protein KC361_g3052 [Hortaea werneckii]KAI6886111.1 hypothetical protein KC325_g3086 [Hortaea werneckii]KAI6995815.1 hypothetical protein KC359_g3903 [Hortaea werneckii]KAI7147465.1 hypothetical protein KC344_g2803 [Hortaea werneckii]KAI7176222.1 hypothetical protein KC360_g3177 [Hortaea werneckii]